MRPFASQYASPIVGLLARRASLGPHFRVEDADWSVRLSDRHPPRPEPAPPPAIMGDANEPRSIAVTLVPTALFHTPSSSPTTRSQCRTRSASPSDGSDNVRPIREERHRLKAIGDHRQFENFHILTQQHDVRLPRSTNHASMSICSSDSTALRGDPIATRTRYSGSQATTRASRRCRLAYRNEWRRLLPPRPASEPRSAAVPPVPPCCRHGVDDAHPSPARREGSITIKPSAPTPARRSHNQRPNAATSSGARFEGRRSRSRCASRASS